MAEADPQRPATSTGHISVQDLTNDPSDSLSDHIMTSWPEEPARAPSPPARREPEVQEVEMPDAQTEDAPAAQPEVADGGAGSQVAGDDAPVEIVAPDGAVVAKASGSTPGASTPAQAPTPEPASGSMAMVTTGKAPAPSRLQLSLGGGSRSAARELMTSGEASGWASEEILRKDWEDLELEYIRYVEGGNPNPQVCVDTVRGRFIHLRQSVVDSAKEMLARLLASEQATAVSFFIFSAFLLFFLAKIFVGGFPHR